MFVFEYSIYRYFVIRFCNWYRF